MVFLILGLDLEQMLQDKNKNLQTCMIMFKSYMRFEKISSKVFTTIEYSIFSCEMT